MSKRFFVKKIFGYNIPIQIKNVMSHLHKVDVCLNHATSVSVGLERYQDETSGFSDIWTQFLHFIELPTSQDRYVQSFSCDNIKGHDCSISFCVMDSRTYVWYNNPHGYVLDRDANEFTNINVPNQECLDEAEASEIEDILKNFSVCNDLPMYEAEKIKVLGLRLNHMLSNFRKRGEVSANRVDDIFERLSAWRKLNQRNLPQYHVMSILQLLKLATNSDHLVVVHPSDSMPEVGPQTEDGIDDETWETLTKHGACSLWTKMYMQRVRIVLTEFLERPGEQDEAELLNIIEQVLTTDNLDGEENEQLALAKYMDAIGAHKQWRMILSIVYDSIPDGVTVASKSLSTRSHKKNRLHSDWHVETLWKLDLVLEYVGEALDRKHGVDGIDEWPVDVVCVAGFVEAIYAVASVEARAHPTYLEETAHIASFIVKSRLHNWNGLRVFVNMLRMLISCKHDEGVQSHENDEEPERQSYPLPVLTRADRENGKTHLQQHAKIFGYGALDGSNFIEDKRKKRRRTKYMHTMF